MRMLWSWRWESEFDDEKKDSKFPLDQTETSLEALDLVTGGVLNSLVLKSRGVQTFSSLQYDSINLIFGFNNLHT